MPPNEPLTAQEIQELKKKIRLTYDPPSTWRKLAYIPYSIVLVLQWLFVLLQNLMEVVANGFEEISLHLKEYLHPDEEKPVLTTDKKDNPG